MSTIADPEKYLAGIVLPDRVEQFAPHQCRCAKLIDGELVDRCMMYVYEGPDEPFCEGCREHHWGSNGPHLSILGMADD